MRGLFPLVAEAVDTVMPVERLRWIAFAHVEADECGAVNEFLAAAPHAQVAHGALAACCRSTTRPTGRRAPLADGEVLDLGGAELRAGHRVHAARAARLGGARLLRGDDRHAVLRRPVTQVGDGPAITATTCSRPPIAAEDMFHPTSLARDRRRPPRSPTSQPTTLAIMHGSSFDGDGAAALRDLADVYESRFGCGGKPPAQALPGHNAPVGAQA